MRTGIAAATCLAASLGLASGAAGEGRPSLQPSIDSALAPKSLLLDIVRAGERLVAVGEQGNIVYSDDDGASWSNGAVPVSLMLTSVCFSSPAKGWAVGHEGVILASTDAGASWSVQHDGQRIAEQEVALAERRLEAQQAAFDALPDDAPQSERDDAAFELEDAEFVLEDAQELLEGGIVKPLLSIACIDDTRAWALGAYGLVLTTTDGGTSWMLVSDALENPDTFHWYGMTRTADGAMFLAGEAGMLNRSMDGGETWERLDAGYDGSFFGILAAADASVLTFGLRANVFRSADNGDVWTRIAVPTDSTLLGGQVLRDGRIVLVGANGTVIASEDNGLTFRRLQTKSRDALNSVVMDGTGRLIVAGFGGVRVLVEAAAAAQAN